MDIPQTCCNLCPEHLKNHFKRHHLRTKTLYLTPKPPGAFPIGLQAILPSVWMWNIDFPKSQKEVHYMFVHTGFCSTFHSSKRKKNSQLPASKFKKYAPHDLSVVPSNTKSSPTNILQNPPSAHARRGPGEPTVGLKTWGFLRYKYPSHPYKGIIEIVSNEYCF